MQPGSIKVLRVRVEPVTGRYRFKSKSEGHIYLVATEGICPSRLLGQKPA